MSGPARTDSVLHEAVLFFDRDRVVKEMLYAEFGAVLDQVVGLAEFADREIRAVYVRINARLAITGCVFFLIDFDSQGSVDRQWNLPLAHLLDTAGRGPDLGAGRIRLACRSQCSISWHQSQLWDPLVDGEQNSFRMLLRALRGNRLGIPVDDTDPDADIPLLRLDLARDQQPLRIAAMKADYQEQVDQLHRRYRAQLAAVEESLAGTRQQLLEERRQRQALRDRLAQQVRQFKQLRERWQQELSAARRDDQGRSAALSEEFELELKARLDSATAELREQLDTREVELFYREEQLASLRNEVTRLRRERESMLQHSGDRVLRRLAETGVAFVAYQPGAEHMTIPLGDLARYMEGPLEYTASQCAVTPAQYRQWLSHYQLPVCTATGAEGDICGEPIAKVERPSQFMPGENDCCPRHRMASAGNDIKDGIRHGS